MLRLFVPSVSTEPGAVRIGGTELRHLRTLRLGPGARLLVLDGAGNEHEVVLDALGTREARATVLRTDRPQRDSPLDLVLAPALLKGAKMDLVVEKATEIGVHRLVPVVSRYAIGQRVALERWRRIAVAASKQSGRARLPTIDPPTPLDALLQAPWPGLRLLAWEGERGRGLADLPATAAAVVIAVGPEGGFDDAEVDDAHAHGFETVRLAGRVLRAETAAVVAAALCQHRWGDG
jgi:16S rRNA (uracil1498-N3)-methyltransferase